MYSLNSKYLKIVTYSMISFYRRKAVNEQKDLKLLLDIYKGMNKDKRDKAQLMLIEKKLRAELEDLKQQMRRLQVSDFQNRREVVSFYNSTWYLILQIFSGK